MIPFTHTAYWYLYVFPLSKCEESSREKKDNCESELRAKVPIRFFRKGSLEN